MKAPALATLMLGIGLAAMSLKTEAPSLNGKVIRDFRLKNTDGRMVSLSGFPAAKGFMVVFTCNHCPFAKAYPQRLNDLDRKYKPLGIPVIAISSEDTTGYEEDSYPNMIKFAKEKAFRFPYLYDPLQIAGKDFGAIRTPHAFLVWKERGTWKIKYNGAIDDNGAEPAKVKHHFLADAVDAMLAGKDIPVEQTRSVGCSISYR